MCIKIYTSIWNALCIQDLKLFAEIKYISFWYKSVKDLNIPDLVLHVNPGAEAAGPSYPRDDLDLDTPTKNPMASMHRRNYPDQPPPYTPSDWVEEAGYAGVPPPYTEQPDGAGEVEAAGEGVDNVHNETRAEKQQEVVWS